MYKLYSLVENHDTIFECWGASTKHPDSRFRFSDFKKSEFSIEWMQIYPWLLECASRMEWLGHTKSIADYANKCYDAMMAARRKELEDDEVENNG